MDPLKLTLAGAETQFNTFKEKKTAVSATRARSDLLKLQKQCGELRKAILAESKQLKVSKTKTISKREEKKPEVEEVEQEAVPPVISNVKQPKKTQKRARKKKEDS